ncbi:MAG: protein adenylyltransferase SelO [Vampirovibrionales bacterium]
MPLTHTNTLRQAWSCATQAFTPQEVYTPLYTELQPEGLPSPTLMVWNSALAQALGLPEDLTEAQATLTPYLSGNQPWHPQGGYATVYAGHQFGHFVPQLGDGRAYWLTELPLRQPEGFDRDTAYTQVELQLKGAGDTPYSRRADGRAVLRSSLREYLASEAMAGLGIPTTRALALVVDREYPVYRETTEQAAIVTRVSPSFLRFGHAEFYYYNGQHHALKAWLEMLMRTYYTDILVGEGLETTSYQEARFDQAFPTLCEALALRVAEKTATLMAHWQSVGFCHGVMNTDNFSALGFTLDYGPYGFMDGFDLGHICNHSDTQGRYAYHQQPVIGLWNVMKFAQCLVPFLHETQKETFEETLLQYYQKVYIKRFEQAFQAKLGLTTWQTATDTKLLQQLLHVLDVQSLDMTLFFRALGDSQGLLQEPTSEQPEVLAQRLHQAWASWLTPCLKGKTLNTETLEWLQAYQARLLQEPTSAEARQAMMHRKNPLYVCRNYLAQEAITAAEQGQWEPFHTLLACLSNPFTPHPHATHHAGYPPSWSQSIEVSCSS